ncbi:MAG: hypothetical protein JNM94_08735 [Phycisphaerae bacterium]|nr:hypothetical protein [Phycisphaerae bacterium]
MGEMRASDNDEAPARLGLGVRRDGWWWRLGVYALVNVIVGYVAILALTPILVVATEWPSLDEWLALATEILEAVVAPFGVGSGNNVDMALMAGLASFVVTGIQVVFLLPLFRPPLVGDRSRSIVLSAIAGAFVVSALLGGVAWTILEALTGPKDAADVVSPVFFWLTPFVALVPSWILWSSFLFRRSQRRAAYALDFMLAPLWIGSAASIAVMLPIDAMTRNKKDCYCATGGFFGLCLSVCGVVFLVGPTILLLATRSNRRWIRTRACRVCGYRRVPGSGPACPECGATWTSRRRSRRVAA